MNTDAASLASRETPVRYSAGVSETSEIPGEFHPAMMAHRAESDDDHVFDAGPAQLWQGFDMVLSASPWPLPVSRW